MMLQAAKLIGAGLCTIAFDGVGGGIGTIVSALIISVARNPHLMKQLFAYAILGFAFTEAVALFALMMAFQNLFEFVPYGALIPLPFLPYGFVRNDGVKNVKVKDESPRAIGQSGAIIGGGLGVLGMVAYPMATGNIFQALLEALGDVDPESDPDDLLTVLPLIAMVGIGVLTLHFVVSARMVRMIVNYSTPDTPGPTDQETLEEK